MRKNELKVRIPTDDGKAELTVLRNITKAELKVFNEAMADLMKRLAELNPELNAPAPEIKDATTAEKPQIMVTGDEVGGFITSNDDSRIEIAKKAGLFLRNYREKRAVQRMEISEQTGMSYSSVFNLEKGTSVPSVETLARFAEIYGCDVKIAFVKNDDYDASMKDATEQQ